MLVSYDNQVKSYIKKMMKQLDCWMLGGKISNRVHNITSKESGECIERWQLDVKNFGKGASSKQKAASKKDTRAGAADRENAALEDAQIAFSAALPNLASTHVPAGKI